MKFFFFVAKLKKIFRESFFSFLEYKKKIFFSGHAGICINFHDKGSFYADYTFLYIIIEGKSSLPEPDVDLFRNVRI